jgi:hypothetical protein
MFLFLFYCLLMRFLYQAALPVLPGQERKAGNTGRRGFGAAKLLIFGVTA